MLTLAILPLFASAMPVAAAPGIPTPECASALRHATQGRMASMAPGACWRVGPIILGMQEPEVERRLGQPARRLTRGMLTTTVHVFADGRGSLILGGRARFRLAELRYVGGQLAAVDENPGTTTTVSPRQCQDAPALAGKVEQNAPSGPLLHFDGVGVGDLDGRITLRFGARPSWNRSRDWYNYLPMPVSFDVDPNRGRIVGFAIARDQDMLTAERPQVQIIERADPNGCALIGLDFGLAS